MNQIELVAKATQLARELDDIMGKIDQSPYWEPDSLPTLHYFKGVAHTSKAHHHIKSLALLMGIKS